MTTETQQTAQDSPSADSATQSATTSQGAGSETQTAQDQGPVKTALTNAAGGSATQPADPSTETKKDGEADSTDGQGQDKDKGDPEGEKPIEYADFQLPENMEMDKGMLDEFKTLAQGAKIPQEQAQKFVDMGTKIAQTTAENLQAFWAESYAKKVESWHSARAADTEIGGTEEAQTAALSAAASVVRAVGGESLLKALDETGAGNHPEVIRAFYRLRQVVGPDGALVLGNQGGSSPKTAAQVLYPNLPTAN